MILFDEKRGRFKQGSIKEKVFWFNRFDNCNSYVCVINRNYNYQQYLFLFFYGLKITIISLSMIIVLIIIFVSKDLSFLSKTRLKSKSHEHYTMVGMTVVLEILCIINHHPAMYLIIISFAIVSINSISWQIYLFFLGYSQYHYGFICAEDTFIKANLMKEYSDMQDMLSMETNRQEGKKYFKELAKYYYYLLH